MTKSKVITRDLGYARILRELNRVGGLHVTVGVHGDVGTRADGTSQVLVASANEFGTADGHVPERSFIRSTMDARRNDLASVTEKALGRVADGKVTAKSAAEIVGQFATAAIKKTITTLSEPPNAPSTVERKGSSNPLVDTGSLRNDVTHKVIQGRPAQRGSG